MSPNIFTKLAKVLKWQQQKPWSCSAACFKTVLHHLGIEIEEEKAIKLIGTKPNKGAETDQIVEAAHRLGLSAYQTGFNSIEEVKQVLEADNPIICDIQSFNKPGSGHYVVLVSIENDIANLMDPNTPSNWRKIPIEEFDKRWWDRRMVPPHQLMKRWGIVIERPNKMNKEALNPGAYIGAGIGGLVGAGTGAVIGHAEKYDVDPMVHYTGTAPKKLNNAQRKKKAIWGAVGLGLEGALLGGIAGWKPNYTGAFGNLIRGNPAQQAAHVAQQAQAAAAANQRLRQQSPHLFGGVGWKPPGASPSALARGAKNPVPIPQASPARLGGVKKAKPGNTPSPQPVAAAQPKYSPRDKASIEKAKQHYGEYKKLMEQAQLKSGSEAEQLLTEAKKRKAMAADYAGVLNGIESANLDKLANCAMMRSFTNEVYKQLNG